MPLIQPADVAVGSLANAVNRERNANLIFHRRAHEGLISAEASAHTGSPPARHDSQGAL
jgi:hypothetical protein